MREIFMAGLLGCGVVGGVAIGALWQLVQRRLDWIVRAGRHLDKTTIFHRLYFNKLACWYFGTAY
jgi:hypothetical protein